jgi:hypothetical protein
MDKFNNEVDVKELDIEDLVDDEKLGHLPKQINKDYWVRYPIQMKKNEHWLMQEVFVGMEGPYAVATWNVNGIGDAKVWRDAKPGRKLFWKLVMEQLTEVLEQT